MPQLSHADRRAQLDALMANYTGPITHIASVKLSPSGVNLCLRGNAWWG
jgi:hypothetical protein